MFIEITKGAFNALGGENNDITKVIPSEGAIKTYYTALGMVLLVIYNHVEAVTQYYLQDINA